MDTISAQIDKILNYKTWNDKKKENALLEMDANLRTNIGTDSTKTEIETMKKESRKIVRAIKKVNWELGGTLLYTMDK